MTMRQIDKEYLYEENCDEVMSEWVTDGQCEVYAIFN